MQGTLRDGVVHVGGDARQRFHDAGGYGRPADGDALELAPVEAAHLLFKGDLQSVDGMGFREFLTHVDAVLRFVVYKDFRDRGFYLSPRQPADDIDLVVYPRGKGPWDDAVEYRVRVVGEREPVAADSLAGEVLAVVDEDGELTYFSTDRVDPGGTADYDPPADLDATLMDDRLVVWDPPNDLYEGGFFGQRLHGRSAESGPLQLSLVEAAYLARQGALSQASDEVEAHARDVEGDRFDRRLAAYEALREAGAVPKSGFKFGSDFRVYEAFGGVADLGHSDTLVRVLPRDHVFLPRDLSLDVRLAGGVRKRMVFALTGTNGEIDWLSVARLTP